MPAHIGHKDREVNPVRDGILDMWDAGDSIQEIVEHYSYIKVESGKRKGKNKITPEYVASVIENYGTGLDYPITKTYIKKKAAEWRMVCHNILMSGKVING
jgi:hypothetical protein